MKESTELNKFLGQLTNATALSLNDGKLTGPDLINYLPALSSAPEALRGIREIGREAHTATIEQNEAVKAELRRQLTSLSPIDQYYTVEGMHGLQCIFRFIAKEAYERGLADGAAAAAAAASTK